MDMKITIKKKDLLCRTIIRISLYACICTPLTTHTRSFVRFEKDYIKLRAKPFICGYVQLKPKESIGRDEIKAITLEVQHWYKDQHVIETTGSVNAAIVYDNKKNTFKFNDADYRIYCKKNNKTVACENFFIIGKKSTHHVCSAPWPIRDIGSWSPLEMNK